MRVYYFDDSGDRSGDPTKPYFALGGFGIEAARVPELGSKIRAVAERYGMPLGHPVELKFNQVGRSKDNKPRKPHWMIRAGLTDPNERRAFVYSALREAAQVPSVEFLCVVVDQRQLREEAHPLKEALTPLLERIQMNAKKHATHALVLMDEEQADDKALREVMRNGSEFLKYDRILDTIAFIPSEESIGIQVADLAAGAISRYFNSNDPGYVRTFLRSTACSPSGDPNGYGIKVYPFGRFAGPARRSVPWGSVDREIHQIEFARYPGATLGWRNDGAPTFVWRHDWDSGLD